MLTLTLDRKLVVVAAICLVLGVGIGRLSAPDDARFQIIKTNGNVFLQHDKRTGEAWIISGSFTDWQRKAHLPPP